MQSGNSVYKDGVLSVAVVAVFDSLLPPPQKRPTPFFQNHSPKPRKNKENKNQRL